VWGLIAANDGERLEFVLRRHHKWGGFILHGDVFGWREDGWGERRRRWGR
jgi:hypothetical protein